MGKCCSKSSEAAPKEPFEVVTAPPAVASVNPMTAADKATQAEQPRTPRPAPPTTAVQKAKRAVAARPTLKLPDVPTASPRKQVTPSSPWEITDGV